MKILPKTPSKLLQVALDDMKLTLKNGHKIYMDKWGSVDKDGTCYVCMAGSVMMNTLKEDVGSEGFCADDIIFDKNSNQLHALDHIRDGHFEEFLDLLDSDISKTWDSDNTLYEIIEDWESYDENNPEIFFKQIEDLIVYLKSVNL